MGSGVSHDTGQLAKLEYQTQRDKPVDGNDCHDLETARREIGKLRTLCKLIEPGVIDELLTRNQQSSNNRNDSNGNERKDIKSKGSDNVPVVQGESQILTLLQEKLENRLISLKEAFQKIDTTNSGYITREEFIQSCWYWGIQLEESDFTFLTTTIGSSNTRIQYNEFIHLMNNILQQKGVIIEHNNQITSQNIISRPITALTQPSNTTAEILRSRIHDNGYTMKQAFLKFDKNGSGSIEKDEMKEVLAQFQVPFSSKELDDLFDRYDLNRDQRFQYGEFVRILQMKT